MKKLFLSLLALVVMGGTAMAQSGFTVAKVDVAKLRAAITKSDAEVADAKKGAKAATWIKRGGVLIDAEGKATSGLYVTMPEQMLTLSYGDAPTEVVTLNGEQYTLYRYDNFDAYVLDGAVNFYIPTTIVDVGALDKAYDAFAKAYELDAKQAAKVADGMEKIRARSVENAGSYYSLNDYKTASVDFRRAYKASAHPSMEGRLDSLSLYYAGMTGVMGEEYARALEDLQRSLDINYDYDGDAYRMKFLALYNLDRREEALEALKEGVAKYPSKESLIDMMMRYYAENDGDPTDMIPMVQDAIAKHPTNASLYQGLARVYAKLGQRDEAIDAIRKAVQLTPNDFLSNYLEGFFIAEKADAMNEELGRMTITSRAQFDNAANAVNSVYKEAIAPLEKAYEADPSEIATVELLKNLLFRYRDETDLGAKYTKYNTLFESMQ